MEMSEAETLGLGDSSSAKGQVFCASELAREAGGEKEQPRGPKS
jgi:hypothetical protein